MCTPVGSLGLFCEDGLFGEPGRARLGWPRGGGTERRVLSPEAAVLCQAGRVASDGVPRLSAQVVEQQHRLVCFCANSPPAQTTVFCLRIHMLRHSLSYSKLFLSPLRCTFLPLKLAVIPAFCWVIYCTHSLVAQCGAEELFDLKRHNDEHFLCRHFSPL